MRKYRVVKWGNSHYTTQSRDNFMSGWRNMGLVFDNTEEAYTYLYTYDPDYFDDNHVGKHYTANFSNQFVEQGTKGRCIREKHVNEVGYLLLVNFGPVSIWCIERDLIEVVEDERD